MIVGVLEVFKVIGSFRILSRSSEKHFGRNWTSGRPGVASYRFGQNFVVSPARFREFQGLKVVRFCSTCCKLHFGTNFMEFG